MKTLEIQRADGVRVIRLDRPDCENAADDDDAEARPLRSARFTGR